MQDIFPERFINEQAKTHDIAEIKDCSIAIDATHYLSNLINKPPFQEPLLPALGGLTGIESHIETDLDQWKAHDALPFFVFDGQPLVGQDEVALAQGLDYNRKTNGAWGLYFEGKATEAVASFGQISGVCRPQTLYPVLKKILSRRGLHFLVAPYNASAQLAYFDVIDSDQCAAIMGSQELLLYPISDNVIQSIDWEQKSITYLSKRGIFDALRAASSGLPIIDPLFVDALLMMGTRFLPTFPPLLNPTIYARDRTILDVFTLLRASDKSVAKAFASFTDVLSSQDGDWLDKYQKARMAVHHYVYIAESGEIKINDFEHLTKDNHEYLGLQLPAELFHYLNTGLVSERILGYVTHGQIVIQPTYDGVDSPEYRNLVTTRVVPILETALSLMIPRLHRGIQHKEIHMKIWFDQKASLLLNHRALQPAPAPKVASWALADFKMSREFAGHVAGPIVFEVLSLLDETFAKSTIAKSRITKGIDTADNIVSVVIWRWLHLRGYVRDDHTLTRWGTALGQALAEVMTTNTPEDAAVINEAVLMAFELIRLGILNDTHAQNELHGLPLNGSADDKAHVLLLSRMATLLKMRHLTHGYTGPLSKNLLTFRSLSCTVRDANRDLVDAILASMFLFGQSKRERDDQMEISERLPFFETPDIAMGIAVKTLLDDMPPGLTPESRRPFVDAFQPRFFPFATHFADDMEICWKLFDALVTGVNTLDTELAPAAKAAWNLAADYLAQRR